MPDGTPVAEAIGATRRLPSEVARDFTVKIHTNQTPIHSTPHAVWFGESYASRSRKSINSRSLAPSSVGRRSHQESSISPTSRRSRTWTLSFSRNEVSFIRTKASSVATAKSGPGSDSVTSGAGRTWSGRTGSPAKTTCIALLIARQSPATESQDTFAQCREPFVPDGTPIAEAIGPLGEITRPVNPGITNHVLHLADSARAVRTAGGGGEGHCAFGVPGVGRRGRTGRV